MKALSEMERTQQVEAISSYNSMKSDLMEYLKTFAQEGKVNFVLEMTLHIHEDKDKYFLV